MDYRIEVAAENALIVYFGEEQLDETTEAIAERIQLVNSALRTHLGTILFDTVPSYASILVVFDPYKTDFYAIKSLINKTCSSLFLSGSHDKKVVELPVYYGEEVGLDLAEMSQNLGLSTEQIVELHQTVDYRVFAIGFAPGFAYLGNVDERIACKRLATPRSVVPKGAVGIADRQTAVYPAQSPGGWNIIGRCPIAMFDPNRQPIMPVDVGTQVRFKAIDRATFLQLGGQL